LVFFFFFIFFFKGGRKKGEGKKGDMRILDKMNVRRIKKETINALQKKGGRRRKKKKKKIKFPPRDRLTWKATRHENAEWRKTIASKHTHKKTDVKRNENKKEAEEKVMKRV